MSRKTPVGNIKITPKHRQHMISLLVAPNTRPANTPGWCADVSLDLKIHSHSRVPCWEWGRGKYVSLPITPSTGLKGLPNTKTRRGQCQPGPIQVGVDSRMTNIPNIKPGMLLQWATGAVG